MSRPFRLALPSKGRMHAPAVELARAAGVEVEVNGRALYQHCSQWDIEVLFARSDDIPAWAADGAVETAVAGRNHSGLQRSSFAFARVGSSYRRGAVRCGSSRDGIIAREKA